jgi:hypothetical protein
MNALLHKAREGKPLGIDIIDIHGHIGRYAFAIPTLNVKSIIDSMNKLGIQKTICSHMNCMGQNAEMGNEEVYKAIQAYPGRIDGYISIYPFSRKHVETVMKKWLKAGFVGIKLHNATGLPYNHPHLEPAYKIANQHYLPILFHTWGDENEFEEIEEISQSYQNLSILMAHSGACKKEKYAEFALKHQNVYLDVTFSGAPVGLLEYFTEMIGAHRIVWGSDVYFLNQAQQLGKVVGCNLSQQEKSLILYNNARHLLDRIQR